MVFELKRRKRTFRATMSAPGAIAYHLQSRDRRPFVTRSGLWWENRKRALNIFYGNIAPLHPRLDGDKAEGRRRRHLWGLFGFGSWIDLE